VVNSDKKSDVAVGASILTALGVGYIALKEKAKAALPDFSGVLAKMDVIIAAIEGMTTNIGSIVVMGYPKNANGFISFVVSIPAVNQPTILPARSVPDGFALVIKAAPTNAGTVSVGEGAGECTNPNQAYTLLPNESIALFIDDSSLVYVTSSAALDQVQCICEARK